MANDDDGFLTCHVMTEDGSNEERLAVLHAMMLGAARYYMGRTSIAAECFPNDLLRFMGEIPTNTQWQLCHDVLMWRENGMLCNEEAWMRLAKVLMERNGWQEGRHGMLLEKGDEDGR